MSALHAAILDVLIGYTGLSDSRNDHIAYRILAAIEEPVAAAVQAEREAIKTDVSTSLCLHAGYDYGKDEDKALIDFIVGVITARGDTSALDAAIKAARVEGIALGMERAAEIADAEAQQDRTGCNPALVAPRIAAAIRAGIEEAKGGGA